MHDLLGRVGTVREEVRRRLVLVVHLAPDGTALPGRLAVPGRWGALQDPDDGGVGPRSERHEIAAGLRNAYVPQFAGAFLGEPLDDRGVGTTRRVPGGGVRFPLYGGGSGAGALIAPVALGTLPGRPPHHPDRVGLGLALEAVAGVGDAQPGPVVRTGHRALALLDDVRQLVGERVLVAAAVADDDMVAGGVGAGAHLGGGGAGGGVGVQADVGEVGAEPGFHLLAQRCVQRPARRAQHIVHGGALHRLRAGLLVTAVRAVPVPVALEHPEDGGVAGGALESEKHVGHPAGRGRRRLPRPLGGAPGGAVRLLLVLFRLVRAHGLPLVGLTTGLCTSCPPGAAVPCKGCTGHGAVARGGNASARRTPGRPETASTGLATTRRLRQEADDRLTEDLRPVSVPPRAVQAGPAGARQAESRGSRQRA